MPTRRAFLGATAAGLAGLAVHPAFARSRPPQHLVLRRAGVLDGTGSAAIETDLAIDSGRIVALGPRLSRRGAEEIDLRDLVLAPGFVDIHSHGDGTLDEDPRAESVIRQGITTIVAGQDGSSRTDLAGWFRDLGESPPAVNVAAMVGLGSVRRQVVGLDDRPATADELARMRALVEQALRDGACGASSGLEYTPGGFAGREELTALCRPLAARRLPYATHMRNEDDRLLESIDEAIAVASGAGCPLQVSHLKAQGPRNWANMGAALARLDDAKLAGTDAGFDIYPYVAYQTGLTNLFPLWSRDGGADQFLVRVEDATQGPRIQAETLAKVDLIGGWNNVLLSGVPQDRAAEGKRLGDLAAERGADPYALAVTLLRAGRGQVGMVGFAMSEENVERGLAHPLAAVCSDGAAVALDGPARRGHPHPRSLGTFPRVLGRYVRERRALPLEDAVRKMTLAPAARVGLRSRGRIAVGFPADLVAFDPHSVTDKATFEEPFHYPDGIRLVIVNGEIVLREGERTGARPGQALRPDPA